MSYENLIFETKGNVAYISLNRPQALNSLNGELFNELEAVFDYLYDDRNILGVIITGEGRAFCAGTDITEILEVPVGKSENAPERIGDHLVDVHRVFNKIENYERPVIAAINGLALGGGCELAMCCDIRILSSKAAFGQPEVALGVIACYGGTQRLPKIVGPGIAKEIMFTGRTVKAEEAKQLGWANQVVEPEELLNAAQAMMDVILAKAPIAVKYTKNCINKGQEVSLAYGLEYEKDKASLCMATKDLQNGIQAFLEKRAAVFQNK